MAVKRKVARTDTGLRGGILCLLFMLISSGGFSQGGWFIKYLPVTSVNDSLLGKEIRVDFKSPVSKKLVDHKNIRRILSIHDTVELVVNGQRVPFVECWHIYVDYGSLKDQYLESVSDYNGERLYIKEVFPELITNTTIVSKVRLYKLQKCSTCKFDGEPYQDTSISVNRSDINGILLER
jgi:hypothetical protein